VSYNGVNVVKPAEECLSYLHESTLFLSDPKPRQEYVFDSERKCILTSCRRFGSLSRCFPMVSMIIQTFQPEWSLSPAKKGLPDFDVQQSKLRRYWAASSFIKPCYMLVVL